MARTKSNGGDDADGYRVDAGDQVSPQTPQSQVRDFFSTLQSGDSLSIERTAPIDCTGWLTNIPWDPEMDLHAEIQRVYGGGTYHIRMKRKSADGRIIFSPGSAHIRIAGEPKAARSTPAIVPVSPPFYPQPVAASGRDELQGRLLDILTAQLQGNRPDDLSGLVAKIVETVSTRAPTASGDAMAQLLQSVETAKQLAAALTPPAATAASASGAGRRKNPDDDDDDDDDDGRGGSALEKLAMIALSKFMSQPAAPSPVAPMAGPPGWVMDDGQWRRAAPAVSGPPGWMLQNGQWVETTPQSRRFQRPTSEPEGTRGNPRTVLVPDGFVQLADGRVVRKIGVPERWTGMPGGKFEASKKATVSPHPGNMGGVGEAKDHVSARKTAAMREPGDAFQPLFETQHRPLIDFREVVDPYASPSDLGFKFPSEFVPYDPMTVARPAHPEELIDNPGDPTSEDQGDDDDDEDEPCEHCNGAGVFELEDASGNVSSVECEHCEGTGVEMGPEFSPEELAAEVAEMDSAERDRFLRAIAPTFGLDPDLAVALASQQAAPVTDDGGEKEVEGA